MAKHPRKSVARFDVAIQDQFDSLLQRTGHRRIGSLFASSPLEQAVAAQVAAARTQVTPGRPAQGQNAPAPAYKKRSKFG